MLLRALGLVVGSSCVACSAIVVGLGGAHGGTGLVALVSAAVGGVTAVRSGLGLSERWHRASCGCPFCRDVTA
jgi:hypothetical protein